jgi:hypothetical protein
MRIYPLTACILMLLGSCHGRDEFSGLWKIRKVEIFRNNELKKVIDTGYQCWSFARRTVIEILDRDKVQNTLHVQIDLNTIKSYKPNGQLEDEFLIRKVSRGRLALTSHQQVEDDKYNIIYYLDRVKDTSVSDIKKRWL